MWVRLLRGDSTPHRHRPRWPCMFSGSHWLAWTGSKHTGSLAACRVGGDWLGRGESDKHVTRYDFYFEDIHPRWEHRPLDTGPPQRLSGLCIHVRTNKWTSPWCVTFCHTARLKPQQRLSGGAVQLYRLLWEHFNLTQSMMSPHS